MVRIRLPPPASLFQHRLLQLRPRCPGIYRVPWGETELTLFPYYEDFWLPICGRHAEHYFRVDNARRESNQQGTPPRPTTPADVAMNPEADSKEVDVDRFEPRWDGEVSVSSETSTH